MRFGEPYWDAFAAARRKQLEAAAVSNGDGETVSGEMLEIRLLAPGRRAFEAFEFAARRSAS